MCGGTASSFFSSPFSAAAAGDDAALAAALAAPAALAAMTCGGAALTSVAHTVSMLLNTSSLMLPEWLKFGSAGLRIWDAVWAVPSERERPTPSFVPTRSARIGNGERSSDDDDDDDAAVGGAVGATAAVEGRRPDAALRRSTR